MKKLNKYKYIILATISLGMLIVACNDDVEDLGKKDKPVLTANGPTDITVSEGTDAVLKFKLSKAISEPVQYRIVVLNDGTTATDQDDFVIPGCRSNDPDCIAIEENGGPVGYIFEIPEFTTEYEVNIATIFDDFPEAPETLHLQIISNRTLLGTVNNLFYNVTINNSATDNLNIRLKWDGSFTDAGVQVDNCDLDMDLELYDSSFNLVDTSYDNCPENVVLDSTLPDGTYYLDASLFDTDGHFVNVNIPAFISFLKPGTALNSTYDISSSFPMQDGGLNVGNPFALLEYTIVKNGNIFTVSDPSSVVVFQGRRAAAIKNKAKIKQQLKLKRNKK